MGYYITVEQGVKIYVEDINPGGKKTILFIHGWPLSHRQFEYQFNVLPAMGYRCIGMDWRGFGNSDKPYTGYNYDRMAHDIRVIIGELKLENITLAGHSTGAAIAIRYMSRYQGFGVSKLVLIDAAAPTGFSPEVATTLLTQTLNDRPDMWRGVLDTFFFQYVTESLRVWFMQMGLQAAGWSTAAMIKAIRDENLYSDLAKIAVPTLIIHGIHDKAVPFAKAQEVNKLISNSKLVPLQYSGHGAFYEERDRVNELLIQFIG
nr:alpha/beta hydrolase [Paenibacillus psychroresistens]